MTRLEQPEVAWDDIEALLSQFPGWLALVRALRYPVRPMDNRIVWGPVQSEFTQMSEKDRLRLFEFFSPFSILLDLDLTPQQRVEALSVAGTDPIAFCKEHRHDAIPEIRENAVSVLEVLSVGRTLLRWHRTPREPNELVRQVQDVPHESLLRPAEDSTDSKPTHIPWFKRSTKR